MQQLLLATRNAGKVREISSLLDGIPFEIIAVGDLPGIPEVVEDGATLEENALKKARETYAATGIPSLSDDTGLEVFALAMAPGVRSARYSGESATYAENNRKLLAELSASPGRDRRAQFRCAAAFVAPGVEHVTIGLCTGAIAGECRGSGGLGYDPLFVPDGFDRTFAELSLTVKNTMSHRAVAFQRMKAFLISQFG
jgi:XTP/dITP diphosphohydrolase